MNIYKHLRYEALQKGQIVFKYGDRGSLFYIIISGKIDVYTPTPVDLED